MSYIETCGSGNKLKQSLSCGVRHVSCHVPVALLLSFLGRPWCQWCSNWCACGCSAQGLLVASVRHISGWLTSVEVFVEFHLECLAFCRVGSGDTLFPFGTLGRRQANILLLNTNAM